MDISIQNIKKYDDIDIVTKTKMILIFNALEKGWKIKKKKIHIFFQKTMKEKKKYC